MWSKANGQYSFTLPDSNDGTKPQTFTGATPNSIAAKLDKHFGSKWMDGYKNESSWRKTPDIENYRANKELMTKRDNIDWDAGQSGERMKIKGSRNWLINNVSPADRSFYGDNPYYKMKTDNFPESYRSEMNPYYVRGDESQRGLQ